jgi:exopolysaccharide production protein ExoQ
MPHLILFSFLVMVVWLIRRDIASRPGVSTAIWIPTLWVGIIASRPISMWLGVRGGESSLDGSPADRTFYLVLIVAALYTLSKRQVNWGTLFARNWPILIFYLFFLVSVTWANSPFSSFKRWIKETGNIVVLLVILTEAKPLQAFRAVFVRCSYVLIPLSIIFIRWFPYLGRTYNRHSGAMEAIGATTQKNSLGTMVLACGLVFLWDWLERSKTGQGFQSKLDRFLPFGIAALGVWLLSLCDSKTSIVALVIASAIVCSIRLPLLRNRIRALGTYAFIGAAVFLVVDSQFGLSEAIIRSLGRDMTFTGRTDVWRELRNVGTDPLLGVGFMSFWDDQTFLSKLPKWVGPTAHNGYLEVYLAGGMVGTALLALMLLVVITRINRALADGTGYSAVRFAIVVMMLIANITESNFAHMTPLGFLFLIAAIGEVPKNVADTTMLQSGTNFIPIEDEAGPSTEAVGRNNA